MRLGKRIGFIGLTLMLAASLLTGCGDNNTPPSGNDALSKPGQSNSGMENTGSSSSGTGSGSTGDKTDTPTISKGGRAVKYFNRRDKMTRYNYKVKVEQTENGKTTTSIEQAVTDGRGIPFASLRERTRKKSLHLLPIHGQCTPMACKATSNTYIARCIARMGRPEQIRNLSNRLR